MKMVTEFSYTWNAYDLEGLALETARLQLLINNHVLEVTFVVNNQQLMLNALSFPGFHKSICILTHLDNYTLTIHN